MRDDDVLTAQLGRRPRGDIAVVVRCPYGLPAVIETSARLHDGTPFPTRYYLTCPLAVRLAGTLESSGWMTELNEQLSADERLASAYRDAHARYVAGRDGDADAPSAGGMPHRVKCLHALYAHELAAGNPIGAMVRERIEPIDCPGACVDENGAVQGHKAFRRRMQ